MRPILALAFTLAWASQAPVAAPPAPAAVSGSKVWIDRYQEFEEFLRQAPIQKVADVPIGVTKPRRAFFQPGGLAESAIVKKLPPGRPQGYWESYKSEIAAYEVDKLLRMEMVPPTVERRIEGDLMSAQLWVDSCQHLKTLTGAGKSAPDVEAWNRQVYRQRVFDNLSANIDRNAGNLLVDPAWNLILVDHSRAFTDTQTMPFEKQMNRIDRPIFDRLKALDEPSLKERLGPWVFSDGWIRALLKRRDRIVKHFEKLAAEKGEGEVFIP